MKALHVFNQPRGRGGSLDATRATIRTLRDRGIEVEVFTRDSCEIPATLIGRLRTAASALYARQSVKEFQKFLEVTRPEIVHINELFPLISPWILPECTRRGIPVVMSVDDYHLTCPVRSHFRHGQVCTECLGGREYRAIRNNCRGRMTESLTMAAKSMIARHFRLYRDHVAHYVFPSRFTRDFMVRELAIDAKRTSIIPFIIDIPEIAADPAEGQYIAFAGRFAPEKGIDVLLEASRLSRLPVRLGRAADHLVTVDLPEGVETVINRNREDLDRFYRGARFIVVPSIWFETFGIVGGEAMSRGIPIIVSDIGAVAELVDPGVHGLRFRTSDASDLAEKMQQLWHDPERCRNMGRAAREKMIANNSAARHGAAMDELYRSLCGG